MQPFSNTFYTLHVLNTLHIHAYICTYIIRPIVIHGYISSQKTPRLAADWSSLAPAVRLRSTIAQVVVCLGLFIGVSYQACNKYRCHGDDRSSSWRRSGVDAREQHVLWVAVGASGLAMVCSASMLLESHFHNRRRNGKVRRQRGQRGGGRAERECSGSSGR